MNTWTVTSLMGKKVIIHEETRSYYGGMTRRGPILTGLVHAVRYDTADEAERVASRLRRVL